MSLQSFASASVIPNFGVQRVDVDAFWARPMVMRCAYVFQLKLTLRLNRSPLFPKLRPVCDRDVKQSRCVASQCVEPLSQVFCCSLNVKFSECFCHTGQRTTCSKHFRNAAKGVTRLDVLRCGRDSFEVTTLRRTCAYWANIREGVSGDSSLH